MLNNTTSEKQFSTSILDEAMRELIDVCQQYNDKISLSKQQQIRNETSIKNKPNTRLKNEWNQDNLAGQNKNNKEIRRQGTKIPTICDNQLNQKHRQHSLIKTATNVDDLPGGQSYYINCKEVNDQVIQLMDSTREETLLDSTIERLRQRQSELQDQLEGVLQVAKSLDLKRKRKLSCILEDQDQSFQIKETSSNGASECDEDPELIEFQQVETELRVSELERQLSNIQEELRLRLYKQLLSKTGGGSKGKRLDQSENLVRSGSNQTDDITPSSSSCSDERVIATTSSCSTSIPESISKNGPEVPSIIYSKSSPEPTDTWKLSNSSSIGPPNSKDSESDNNQQHSYKNLTEINLDPDVTQNSVQLDRIVDSDREKLALESENEPSAAITTNGPFHNITRGNVLMDKIDSPYKVNNSFASITPSSMYYSSAPSSLRSNVGNGDLERIDEDDEDAEVYYGDSNRFRTIYEEVLSPVIHANVPEDFRVTEITSSNHDPINQLETTTQEGSSECQEQYTPKTKGFSNNGFVDANFSNVNSQKRKNRPLTLYLPKPDEEIDLIEHIQTLGHDLNIISSDINLSPSCARGYLYKSCSNNSKKWLKRYFYFDRKAKVLAYYENENQLVKRKCSPKSSIPFDDIGDVYVDHKLSGSTEKEHSTKKRNYVFVLSTLTRKYQLASSKAETMRAWIDILYTAANANDYLHQLSENNDSFQEF